jgi:hypothetical protein
MLIHGIELTTLDGVEQDFGSFLNTLEEAVVLGTSSRGLLIRVVTEDLLAMSALDLFFCRLVTVFRETKDGIMILCLRDY